MALRRLSNHLVHQLIVWPIALVCTLAAAQEVQLKWSFEPGEELRYRITQKAELEMELGPAGEQFAEIEQVIDVRWTVVDVQANGGARLRIGIDQVTVAATGPGGQTLEYDSASTEDLQGFAAMLIPTFKVLSEQGWEVVMSPQGKILETDIPEEILQSIRSGPGGKEYEASRIERELDVFARLGAPPELPATSVSSGHQWQVIHETEIPVVGLASLTSSYQFEGPQDHDGKELHEISQELKVEPIAEQAYTVEDQRSSGSILFDPETGKPVRVATEHYLKLVDDGDANAYFELRHTFGCESRREDSPNQEQ